MVQSFTFSVSNVGPLRNEGVKNLFSIQLPIPPNMSPDVAAVERVSARISYSLGTLIGSRPELQNKNPIFTNGLVKIDQLTLQSLKSAQVTECLL
jgi:hypothetical protein